MLIDVISLAFAADLAATGLARPRRAGVAVDDNANPVAATVVGGLTLRAGAASASADRRAARLVGAGGKGIVLKTRCGERSDNKKAALEPRRLSKLKSDYEGSWNCKTQVHGFIMHTSGVRL